MKKRETNIPKKTDQHFACIIHDNICADEQMKAGCQVTLFVCYNCRFLAENGLLVDVNKLAKSILTNWEPK